MKKHDYVRSNLTYWLDDKTQSQVYNFLQKIPRKQAVFVSLLVHKYLSENYDGQLEDITAKDADWIYKWLLLKQHADDMGLDITPYKHIFTFKATIELISSKFGEAAIILPSLHVQEAGITSIVFSSPLQHIPFLFS